MFNDFHKGKLDLKRLNFAMISLIPKVDEAREMKNLDLSVSLTIVLKCFQKF
jgi:hypothetical protein